MKFVADGCARNGKDVSVCGEIAGRPLEAITLVALGYTTLSMPLTGIGPVKSALLKLDAAKLREKLAPLITVESRLSSLRDVVSEFCMEEGIPV